MTKAKTPMLSIAEKLEQLLVSWETVSLHLRSLEPDEVMQAIKAEKAREHGPRMNILFRLVQRYDSMTKNTRLQELCN
jgi:hypothetical protein